MEAFKPGMRVKLYNEEDGGWVHGEVIESGQKGFFVRWDDLDTPSDYSYENMPPLVIETAGHADDAQSAGNA